MALTYKNDKNNKPYAIDGNAELENKFADSEYVLAYLNDVLEDGDYELFFDAIGSIAKLYGIKELSKKIGLNREAMYRALSTKGNPSFKNTVGILGSLGIELSARYKDENRNSSYETVTSKSHVYLLTTVIEHEETKEFFNANWSKKPTVSAKNVVSMSVYRPEFSPKVPKEFTADTNSSNAAAANIDLALAA